MSITFWIVVIIGYAAAIALSAWTSRRIVRAVSENSPRAREVTRAGHTAAVVALLPALFVATVLGGTLGGRLGTALAARWSLETVAAAAAAGAGVGLGVCVVLTTTVAAVAAAGAVFMKVYLAR